jgi:hypothetical protein
MTLSPRTLCLLSVAVAAACARHDGSAPAALVGERPVFETRTEVATGTSAHADYVVDDLDGDGKLDMAVCSLTGELRVLVGNGATFTLGQSEQLGGMPVWMTSGDFDGDGDTDLVVVKRDADSTELWRNDGQATFALSASVPHGAGALSVVAGDFDADGKLDVAIARPIAPEIVYCRGDGLGGFVGTQSFGLPAPAGGQAFHLAAGDATRDGITDLVCSDPATSRLVIYEGAGAGAFGTVLRQVAVPGGAGACAFGDLSGDLLPDLVVSAFDAEKFVVITSLDAPPSVGGPSYQSFDVPLDARPSLATVADVTGDGRADLVGCIAGNARMCVAPQLAGGGVGAQFHLDASGMPLRPFVGDLDGQGRTALFALSGGGERVNVWLEKSDSQLAGARNYASGLQGAFWLDGADFDGDGDAEVVTGSNGDTVVKVMGRDGAGELVVEATVDVGEGVYQIEAVDLDADGDRDLVCAVVGGVRLLRNGSSAGSYAFAAVPGAPAVLGGGQYPFGVAVADVDGQPGLDLVVADHLGGDLHVVPGTTEPFVFGASFAIPVGGAPVDVAAADFDGDGDLDLAVSRSSAAAIRVLRRVGAAWETAFDAPVGQSPNYLVVADFNRDGRADLVVSNANSNNVSVLFGTASGFARQDYAAGSAPTALLARDLTQDGNPDILVASLQSGDFRVMVGDGFGSFPLLPTFPGTLGASDAVLQDMDGDGRPELLVTSLITDRVSLVKNVSIPFAND